MNLDAYLLYIWGAVLITWITLSNSKRYRKASRLDRFHETGFCCAITAVLSLGCIDYLPDVPNSVTLFIGVAVGILGADGSSKILGKFITMAVSFVTGLLVKKGLPAEPETKPKEGDKQDTIKKE